MLKSFREKELKSFWESGKPLKYKTVTAGQLLDVLDVSDACANPRDADFAGFRFDEWMEGRVQRYSVMITQHWFVSYSWEDGNAIGVALEWVE